MNTRMVFLLFYVLTGALFAQTSSLNLVWDPNTEPDMDKYRLLRSEGSTNNFTDSIDVDHPQTQITDNAITPGTVYAYRVAAIDTDGNISPYSPVVSVGIPGIQLSLNTVNNGSDTTLALSSFLVDGDHAVTELQLTFSQENNVSLSVQGSNLVITPSPLSFTGAASFTIRAEDPDGFFDEQTINFTYTEPAQTVFTVNIPTTTIDEDASATLQLDNFVNHSAFSSSDISWSFSGGPDLNYTYNSSNRTLSIQSSAAHWFGQNTISATATAPDQSAASGNFDVIVNSVNDVPVASVPSLNITTDPNQNIFDLKDFADDADHGDLELDWEFFGFTDFQIEWEDQSQRIIRITPLVTPAAEIGFFRVFDPLGAADTASVNMNVANDPGTVLEIQFDDVTFVEDGSTTINLDDAVTASDFNLSELDWVFSPGGNLQFSHDNNNRTLTISPANPDWFGQSDFTATAVAPDQTTATATFDVTVSAVNDPPVANISNLTISFDPDNNLIDLKNYASDVDNMPGELDWSFSGFSHFNFEWFNQSQNIVKIIPLDTTRTENGTFTVQDLDNASDNASVTINVSGDPVYTFNVFVPAKTFPEDQSVSIQMDTTVTLTHYTPSQLTWNFTADEDLKYTFNTTTRMLTIESQNPDWYGQGNISATATAPDQNTAQSTFNVNITSVNDRPTVSMQSLFVSADPNQNLVDLKDYVVDVDDDALELNWTFSGYSDFNIQWENAGQKIIRITPLVNGASETGLFRVVDPQGGADTASVQIVADAADVFEVNISNINFPEDTQYEIFLDTTLTVSNYTPGEISWSFNVGANLEYMYDVANRKLNLSSRSADWSGMDQVTAVATAPNQTSRSVTFDATVNPVNDAPQASVQNFFIGAGSNNTFDMKLYATDVDNSANELNWDFWGFSGFNLTWQDQGNKILRITANGNPGAETGFFRVRDPQGAADTNQVTITYTQENTPPHLQFHSIITIAEDSSVTLNLVNFVVDSTNTIDELSWNFSTGDNVSGFYNGNNYTYTLTPDPDWFGNSTATITVQDPDGLSDMQQVSIVVESRNDIRSLAIQNSGSSANVSFQTDLPSQVDFSYWHNNGEIQTISETEYRQSHSFNLTDLLADSTYFFSMNVSDQSGRMLSIEDSTLQSGTNGPDESDNADDLIVYPNPIKTNQGHREMIFHNLPDNSSQIGLYTLVGEQIYSRNLASIRAEQYRINVVDEVDMPSGLYIYMVKDENSRVLSTGKIVVIR